MRESNEFTSTTPSAIKCLEVLISKESLQKRADLQWTLSVYSLQNQPVKKEVDIHNSEIFHFMLFDWKRTIKKLLDKDQVRYSVTKYFSPASVLTASLDGMCTVADEAAYISAAAAVRDGTSTLSDLLKERRTDSFFEVHQ